MIEFLRKAQARWRLRRNLHQLDGEVVVRFDHKLGGGSEVVAKEWISRNRGQFNIIQVKPRNPLQLNLHVHSQGRHESFVILRCNLYKRLRNFDISKIIVAQLVGYHLKRTIPDLIRLTSRKSVILEMWLQDFYGICPSVHLMTYENRFCGVASRDYCENCYRKITNRLTKHGYPTILDWRSNWARLADRVDEFKVFSDFTRRTFLKAYPSYADKIRLDEIPFRPLRKVNIEAGKTDATTVALLGPAVPHKGLHIMSEIDKLLSTEKFASLRFVLFGPSAGCQFENIVIHGPYVREQLPDLMEQYQVSAVLIPSICAETYGQTVEEAIGMGLPTAIFNLGAPVERIAAYDKGIILSKIDASTALSEICEFLPRCT